MTFSNAGEAPATGVEVGDTLPSGLSNITISSSGVVITQTSPAYTWAVEDLMPGQAGTIIITGVLTSPLTTGITSTALISSVLYEANTSNNSSSVSLSVLNGAPITVDDSDTTIAGNALTLTVMTNDNDPNNDSLSLVSVSTPLSGSAVLSGSNGIVYTPNAGYVGDDYFSYVVSDGVLTATGNVTVTVSGAPGGVGANLALWLKADAGAFNGSASTASNGERVDQWHNQVSNSLVFVHQSADASRPTWQDHQLNGNPVLRFNGSNDLIISQADDLPLGDQARTVIAVASDTSGGSAFRYIMAHGEDAAVNAHFLGQDENTDTLNYGGWASTLLHNNFWTDSSPRVVTGRYAGGTNGLVELFGAGAVLNSNNFTWNTQENSHATFKGFVGRQVWGTATAQAWLGDIAELIIYTDKALTDPELLRVHSYLALKYGLTLSGTNYDASDGTVLWTMGGGYDHDITGIGVDEASGLSQLASRSMNPDSIVTITGTVANVTDGEFLIWGSNGITTAATTNDALAVGYSTRLSRTWQVVEAGDAGAITVSFDLSQIRDINYNYLAGFSLLVDDDGLDFSNAITVAASAVTSQSVTFSGVDFTTGQYFSLAYPMWFQESGQPLANGNSHDIELGDLDNDGDLDALVLRQTQNQIWQNSGGIFTLQATLAPSSYSWGGKLGDLDGDGDLDAFIINENSAGTVWRNDGSGNLTQIGSVGSNSSFEVDLGDLDGDGDLDAFVSKVGANKIWLNNGYGTFVTSGQSLGSANSRGSSLGDLDGDGDLDAVVANTGGNGVWLNNGSGSFTAGPTFETAESHYVCLGDYDGDGDLDAFAVNHGVSDALWHNDGLGNFTSSGQTLGSANSSGCAAGDVDTDGDLDIFVAARGGDANYIWINDGSGNFSSNGQMFGTETSIRVRLGDLDNDGDLDAYVANLGQLDRIYLNNAPPTPRPPPRPD